MSRDLAILAATFALATLLAEALGAANLGTAMTFGQLAFVIVATWRLARPNQR